MGIRIYIEDDQGRQFSQLDWSTHPGRKDFPRILLSPDHLRVLEYHLQVEFNALKRIDECRSIQVPEDKRWTTPSELLWNVKTLIRAFQPSSNGSVSHLLEQLDRAAVQVLGFDGPALSFNDDYFQLDGFLADLTDLERFLYYLKYTKVKDIHVTIC